MTRPALVIGLGGTGQKVLTYLKKELLEIGGGQMPDRVRLLCFDTDVLSSPLENVKLEKDIEYISIGAPLYDLVIQIAAGMHDHLKWFPADILLKKLPMAAFDTTVGAGAIRQLGRLSLFNKINEVVDRLTQVATDLQPYINNQNQLEILFVSSLAGGTGAGTLIDMAYLTKKIITPLAHQNFVRRGFMVLPTAFVVDGAVGMGQDKMARTFAAWNEVDRFMLNDTSRDVTIRYHPSEPNLWVDCEGVAFDVSYMIDPQRPVNPIQPPPDNGIFPAVAQCLALILDEQAGRVYTSYVINDIANRRAQLPVGVYHSAIGSYTIKVPVYYAQQKFSLQLTKDILDQLVSPEIDPKTRQIKVKDTANADAATGTAGLSAVISFLSGAAHTDIETSQTTQNTQFMPMIGSVREARKAGTDGTLVNQAAQGGLTTTQGRYLRAMVDVGSDQAGKKLSSDIANEIHYQLWNDARLKPSADFGDKPEDSITRLVNGIPESRNAHYGLDDAHGKLVSSGSYGNALEKAMAFQVERFTSLLSIWLKNTLNGSGLDPITAKSGKLGYAYSFMAEMVDTINQFRQFINNIQSTRSQVVKPKPRAAQAEQSMEARFRAEAGHASWVTFWDGFTHPDAHQAQRNYLRAAQAVADVRKDEILIHYMGLTAKQFQEVAEDALNSLKAWIAVLAEGDPAIELVSLYKRVDETLSAVQQNFEFDRRLGNLQFEQTKAFGKVSQVIGAHEYKSDPLYVKNALNQIEWKIELDRGNFNVILGVQHPAPGNGLPLPPLQTLRTGGEKPTDYNLAVMTRLADVPYKLLKRDKAIVSELPNIFATGDALAVALYQHPEPFYSAIAVGSPPVNSASYIRLYYQDPVPNAQQAAQGETPRYITDATATTKYVSDFQTKYRTLRAGVQSVVLAGSEDPHKMTIVRSDDLMLSTNFRQYESCRKGYYTMIDHPNQSIPAEELYIFPQEINAAYYEGKMPSYLTQPRRKLLPVIVALLENREKFRSFWLAIAHGWLTQKTDNNGIIFWVYQSPSMSAPFYFLLPDDDRLRMAPEDYFKLVRNFLKGVDLREGHDNLKVKWDELKNLVKDLQFKSTLQCETIYTNHAKEAGGEIISCILNAKNNLPQGTNPNVDTEQRQRFQDLADLGCVVFKEELVRIENIKKNANPDAGALQAVTF